MAGVFKRASDRARGKAGKWTGWWRGEDGKKHMEALFTDRERSLTVARNRETEATLVQERYTAPAARPRREASFRAIGDHLGDYHRNLLAKGDTEKHARDVEQALLA